MALKITKAVRAGSADSRAAGDLPGYDLIRLEFSDGTQFSIFPEGLGFPRIYAHELLDEYLKAGGKLG